MTLNREAILEVCEVISQQEHLKVTVKESAKGAMITGLGALSGGLLAGPIGLAIGGTLASITAAVHCRGKFKSVVDVLRNDLTPVQRRKLTDSVGRILNDVTAEDAITLATLILSSQSLKYTVVKEIASFLAAELNLNMITA